LLCSPPMKCHLMSSGICAAEHSLVHVQTSEM
jgi:hypothetical protein